MYTNISFSETRHALLRFSKASTSRALIEFAAALLLFGIAVAIILSEPPNTLIRYLYLVFGVILLAAGQIKLFTIEHDCGHYSFSGYRSR
jgi:fatty acid desaturase